MAVGRVLGVCGMDDGRARQPHDSDGGDQAEASELRGGGQCTVPEPGGRPQQDQGRADAGQLEQAGGGVGQADLLWNPGLWPERQAGGAGHQPDQ